MLPEVEQLLLVQHRDQKIRALEKEIAGLPVEAEDIRDRLAAEKAAVESAKSALQEVEIAIKNLELDVQTRRDSIARLKVQQFETKKNEEFRAMGDEIRNYESQISELEDREIELMEQAEEMQKRQTEALAALEKSQASVDEDLSDLEELESNLGKEIEAEKAERTKAAASVDEDLLYQYERLFQGKNGKAVVGLVDGVCEGCHMNVVKSTVVEVKAENHVAYCENCGRILYWWTDDSGRA